MDNQLKKVKISNSITTIDSSVFQGNQLTSIEIPDSVTVIEGTAFNDNKLTNVSIPDSVISIGPLAFAKNNLKSIVIPNSVTTLGYSAFNDNQLPEDQAFIYARNNGSEDNKVLVSYGGANRNRIVIPEGVEIIEGWSFSDFAGMLTEITLPNSLRIIREGAFSYVGFTNLVIPEGVETIEGEAFSWAIL